MNPRSSLPLVALASFSLIAASPAAHAQTVVTGTYTGGNGTPGGGTYNPDDMIYHGNDADQAYTAPNPTGTTFVFNNVTATGGTGGAVDGTDDTADYQGGDGGNGLLSQGGGTPTGVQATVNSGTYTGGVGGAVTGVGNSLNGGYGGGGIDINNSIAIINGGTFTGGQGGPESGTPSGPNFGGGFSGSGLNSNFNATVTVNGGTFTGANSVLTNDSFGMTLSPAGDGIINLGANTFVYGGTFAGGTGTFPGDTNPHENGGFGLDFFDGTLTVYGTNFTVTDTTNNTVRPNFSGALPQGQGFITGKLANNAASSTFSYRNLSQGGDFTLSAPVAAPEPSQWAAFGVGLLGLGALAIKTRRKVQPA